MEEEEGKIQIVAFSTNDTNNTPNDIINIYLNNFTHSLIKKSRHAIAFSIVLPNSTKSRKVMICSVINLTREYTGMNDVNCYMIFIDLEMEDVYEKLDNILSYAKIHCDADKKVFVLGIITSSERKQVIYKSDIIKLMEKEQVSYEYKELNIEKSDDLSSKVQEIMIYCSKSKNKLQAKFEDGKDGGQSNSCEII